MKRKAEKKQSVLWQLPALCCALLMLCVVPLAVRQAFFDINRVKVELVTRLVPLLAEPALLAWLFSASPVRDYRSVLGPVLALAFFALACTASAWRAGFSPAVLTGNQGRYCGLGFILALVLSFYVILSGGLSGSLAAGCALAGGAAIAVLAVVNVSGADPFGFYVGIRDGLQSHFLSTIGYINFVGGVLALLLPLSAALCAFGSGWISVCGGLCAVVLSAGLCAARSDAPLLAFWLSMLMLLVLCGDSAARMGRVLLLWSACFMMVPAVGLLLPLSPYGSVYMGFFRLLSGHGLWLAAAVPLAMGGGFLIRRTNTLRMPGRRRLTGILCLLMALCAAVFLLLCLYFTFADKARNLGALQEFLRYDDDWASGRGTVYTRCVRALASYSPVEWLFGRGLDTLWPILKPYFNTPQSLAYGTFTDAHNHILHYLLTTGLFGAVGYAAFYILSVRALWRAAGEDAILCGILASLVGYSAIMMFSVAQPVMLAVYVPLAALGLGRSVYLCRKEEKSGESGTAAGQTARDACLYGKCDALGDDPRA